MLTPESQSRVDIRAQRGRDMVKLCWGIEPMCEDDFDAACKDAISDILTARFGPAGHMVVDFSGGYVIVTDADVWANASSLVDAALQSYYGDAEDYINELAAEWHEPTNPAVDAIKAAIEAKKIESHRIFLYAGGQEDAFREDVSDEEIDRRFHALNDETSDKIYEGFRSEDYEAMDEINGVLGGLELALRLIEES